MMIRPVMAGFVSLSVLVAAAAQQDSPKKESDQTDRAEKLGDQRGTEKKRNDHQSSEQSQRTALPECLTQLDLTRQQTQDLLAIYRDSDRKSQQIWDHVQGLHRQAISMEAAAIAAARLEGHVHSAHQGQVGQPTDTDTAQIVNPEAAKESTTTKAVVDDKPTANAARKENAEKRIASKNRDARHANAAKNHQRDGKPADARKHSDVENSVGWQGKDGELNIVAIRVGIAQPDGKVREYLLTQPGENTSSGPNQAFHSHQAQLTQIWKDIHDGHEQLVELEASTIVNVEAQLTEPQLEKLDTIQSKVSNTSTDDVSR